MLLSLLKGWRLAKESERWHLLPLHPHKRGILNLKPYTVPGELRSCRDDCICWSRPVSVFQGWMIRSKSRPKILKILSAAPSNSTTSISSNGNSVITIVPGTLLSAYLPTCRINNKFPFFFSLSLSLPALKVWKDATMYTTWLRSPWSHPTAPCGTRLSPSPASRWPKCCPASSWSERSRRSSVPARRTWAKPRKRTGLAGHGSSVAGYRLCSIHPNPINLSILDSVLL